MSAVVESDDDDLHADHGDGVEDRVTQFGSELAELSDDELERRASDSVEAHHALSGAAERQLDKRGEFLREEAERQLDKRGEFLREEAERQLDKRGEFLREEAERQLDKRGEFLREEAGESLGFTEGLFSTGDGDDLPCQNAPTVPATCISYPWKGTGYAEDKSRFFKYVRRNRYHGRQTRLSEAVRHVYGQDSDNTEYKRLSRFAQRCDWFAISSKGGYVAVEPTPECFETGGLELRSNRNAKRPDGDGISFDTSQTGAETGGQSDYPKDRVRRVLGKRVRLDGGRYKDRHDHRREIFRELVQYREDIGDKFSIFKRLRGQGSEYKLIPCLNRFNDTGRATKSRGRVETALQRASEDFHRSAVLTVTVDPNRFESHTEATEALSDNVGNLMQTLSYRLGGSPTNLKVLEFQRNGLPHYHIVLFGVGVVEDGAETETGEATISTEGVREYWDTKRGMGSQVDVRPAYCRGDDWVLHEDSDGRVSLSYYLTKASRDLITVAETGTEALFDRVESGDLSLWRQALYWAYDKQYSTCSPCLKDGDLDDDRGDDGTPPAVVIWEYVGTAKYEQIPSQIVDNAVLCRSHPPP